MPSIEIKTDVKRSFIHSFNSLQLFKFKYRKLKFNDGITKCSLYGYPEITNWGPPSSYVFDYTHNNICNENCPQQYFCCRLYQNQWIESTCPQIGRLVSSKTTGQTTGSCLPNGWCWTGGLGVSQNSFLLGRLWWMTP